MDGGRTTADGISAIELSETEELIASETKLSENYEEEETDETETVCLTKSEIELIALVTMAEAEDEYEYGKRLVIDTVLNRVDSNRFPNSVYGVVYQPHQFSSMWNGRVDRCYVRDDICQIVREELLNRTNYDVIFFNIDHYSKYGEPMFEAGNHYFSSGE